MVLFFGATLASPVRMKRLVMMTLLAGTVLTVRPVFGAQVSIGIRIGPPPPPRVVYVVPARPAPEFIWVDGYWYAVGNHWKWHQGYWTQPPYIGASWAAPHYEGGQFFAGYWAGERGRIEHDHHWDHDRDRDFRERHGKGHRKDD
jgi:hypothetical protein